MKRRKVRLFDYERRHEPLAPLHVFRRRLLRSGAVAALIVAPLFLLWKPSLDSTRPSSCAYACPQRERRKSESDTIPFRKTGMPLRVFI